jgi:hypothetical protein
MQGEVPKVGDIVPATLSGELVKAKVDRVSDPTPFGEERGEVTVKVHAEEI